jgi:hypothetical protein
MNKDNTISLQEVRRNPLGFFNQINKGKKITVIYHSKPLVTVTNTDSQSQTKSLKKMLEYTDRAHRSAKTAIDSNKSYKEIYYEDMAKKYGIS